MYELLLLAHMFYSDACCSGIHCHPVPCEEILAAPDGWQWRDKLFHRGMLKLAPDGQCHVCVAVNPICIYLPPRV